MNRQEFLKAFTAFGVGLILPQFILAFLRWKGIIQ